MIGQEVPRSLLVVLTALTITSCAPAFFCPGGSKLPTNAHPNWESELAGGDSPPKDLRHQEMVRVLVLGDSGKRRSLERLVPGMVRACKSGGQK
ncbi:MAG: hypothetical protein O7A04_06290, partial [Acidobacteria bacterium]|nr:hypothetical protein [Acidobacteriota bacterium]